MSSSNEQLTAGVLAEVRFSAESEYAGRVCEILAAPEAAAYLHAMSGETRRGLICRVRHYDGSRLALHGLQEAMPVKWLRPLRGSGRRPANRDELDLEEFRQVEGDFAGMSAQEVWGAECPAYLVS